MKDNTSPEVRKTGSPKVQEVRKVGKLERPEVVFLNSHPDAGRISQIGDVSWEVRESETIGN
jgi:hypothetical protein